MNNKYIVFGILILSLLFTSACNVTKYLAEDELLYAETKIKYASPEKITDKKTLRNDLEDIAQPTPNTGFLFNTRLWIYYQINTKKEKGFKHWLKYKLGEEPALYSDTGIQRNRLQMRKYLRDNGYFDNEIDIDTTLSKKRVKATYTLTSRGQYQIDSVGFPATNNTIGRLIKSTTNRSFLKPNTPYQKINLDNERLRIQDLAQRNGFPNFREDYLYYFADTIPGMLRMNILMKYKEPENGAKLYEIGDTYVFPNYNITDDGDRIFDDTLRVEPDISVIQNYEILKPKTFDRLILQDKGETYNKRKQDATVSHLLDLGIFKFANSEYVTDTTTTPASLDRYLYLTPGKAEQFSLQVEVNNRTGSYLGTEGSIGYKHKNLFRGGELFEIRLSGGIENQLINNAGIVNTADISLEGSISFPYFVLPFKYQHQGFYIPRTRLQVGIDYEWRTSFFNINTENIKFGYEWKENAEKQHQVFPFTVRRVALTRTTAAFDSLLTLNPRLNASFQNVLINGLEYNYVYTNQKQTQRQYWFFRGELDVMGNALTGLLSVINEQDDQPYSLWNTPVAQFIKVQTDLRRYWNFKRKSLISRLVLGAGFAYGNSDILPYVEQFFVGGANSLRAFPLRGLGPGTFLPDANTTDSDVPFFDQTGDLKLEFQLEYRFPVFSYLKGAVFTDIGNVWLFNDSETNVGQFDPNTFIQELGVGTGVGLRLDLEFFVLRLDAAFPIRKPILNEGFQWTIDEINVGSKDWRQENLIWNLAIGYPF